MGGGRLDGKIALVTAAGQGIGRSTALAFAREGAIVFATDVKASLLDALNADAITAGLSDLLKTFPLDVLSISDIDYAIAFIQASGHHTIHVLFNCAGFVHDGTLLDVTDEQIDFAFDLNIKAMMRISRAFLPIMKKNDHSSIINMSSVASSIKGASRRCVYATTKAAVIGLTKSIAVDFVKDGVRCNCICPGTVDTPSLQGRINDNSDPKQARIDFISRQKMGRIGTPEDIASICVYLGSDESSYTTGQEFIIDGGWSM